MQLNAPQASVPRPAGIPGTPPACQAAANTPVGAALLAAALCLPLGEPVHAETAPERGLIGIKYLDYLDSQPGESRIRVRAPALGLIAPISSEWSVGGSLIKDTISGASPLYQSSSLTKMHDERRAVDANLTRYFPNGTITVGANLSSESDYLSRGLSIQATRSDETKNTTWSIGLAASRDAINPTNKVVENESKRVHSILLGLTQILSARDIVQVNLGHTAGRGYYSDPYKFADDRPRRKDSSTLMVRWNHHFESLKASSRFTYRYHTDNWGVRSHTLGLEYVQPLADGWTITPLARVYSQSAARFYVPVDASQYPFGPEPGVRYSEDQRLSAFGARTLGLKVAKQIGPDWLVDLKVEQYGQRGAWRLFGSGSSGLAAFNARSVQIGISRLF